MLYRRFATVFVLRLLWSHFQSQNWAIEKEKTSTEVLLLRFLMLSAVRGGFEPPVQLPVRQFSKLVVSATHPSHLKLSLRIGLQIYKEFIVLQLFDSTFCFKLIDKTCLAVLW